MPRSLISGSRARMKAKTRARAQTSELPAVLFDLDGTLIDSVYQYVQAWHETLRDAGIRVSIWKVHRRVGMKILPARIAAGNRAKTSRYETYCPGKGPR
jgi:phosphoglycolate phosphatase-like HAD superfamily hydrolase